MADRSRCFLTGISGNQPRPGSVDRLRSAVACSTWNTGATTVHHGDAHRPRRPARRLRLNVDYFYAKYKHLQQAISLFDPERHNDVTREYAAGGGSEHRRYPWGQAPPSPTLLNACDASCIAGVDFATAMSSVRLRTITDKVIGIGVRSTIRSWNTDAAVLSAVTLDTLSNPSPSMCRTTSIEGSRDCARRTPEREKRGLSRASVLCMVERHALRMRPTTAEITNRTIAAQNSICAPLMAVPATPPKPKKAATSATMRNMTA